MPYFLISIAALLFSSQFLFNQGYEKENGSGIKSTIKLSFYTAIIGIIVTLIVNKFKMQFSWECFAFAAIYGIACLGCDYCTIKTFEYANLSVYTVFSMIGGMALPFAYGALCGENISIVQIICFVLIIISIFILVQNGKHSKKGVPYYIGVFVFNGMVGVIAKMEQTIPVNPIDNESFLILTKAVILAICAVAVVFTKDIKINIKSVGYCTGISVLNTTGNLLLLIALMSLPASIQYPMVTGGTIVFATLFDIIRKVKITKRVLIATLIALVASCLMAL